MKTKKILAAVAALTIVCGAVPTQPFAEDVSNMVLTAKAEEDDAGEIAKISVQDLEELSESVPAYSEYYTEDSYAELQQILNEISDVDIKLCESEQIEKLYNNLKNAIENLKYKTAEVPQIYISTQDMNGNSIVKADGYVTTKIAIVDSEGNVISDDEGLIKVRGNSTAAAPKKPFALKFSSKQDVLGMGKAKKWVLLANCFDPTLLRNDLAFGFAEYMGLEYTSERKWTELWVDGVFKGCYLLTEPVETGKTRADIDVDKGSDFLIEYEKNRNESDELYLESNGYRFILSEPEEPTEERIQEIQEKLDEITAAINTEDYDTFINCIDIDSFAKFYILNEYFKTIDFGYSSVNYYYKNGRLYAGPAWDYDLSSGNCNPDHSYGYKQKSLTSGIMANLQLYSKLCKSNQFMNKVKSLYTYYQMYIMDITAEGGQIDSIVNKNQKVIERNFSDAGWGVSKSYSTLMRKPDSTYTENVEFLRKWLIDRNNWLCEDWHINPVIIDGANLILDGTLKVKLVFNADITEDDGLTINGKPVSTTDKAYIYEAPAKDFKGDIVVMRGNEEVSKFSISNMIDAYKKNETTKNIAEALEAYCEAADAYFNDGNVADNSTKWESVKTSIGSHDVTMGDDYYGSSLLLKSGTVLRHYYTEDAEGRTEKDGFYYVDEVVPAHQYSGSGDYCVNDYIYKALKSEKADDSHKNLCVALYNYGKAAEKYIGGTK